MARASASKSLDAAATRERDCVLAEDLRGAFAVSHAASREAILGLLEPDGLGQRKHAFVVADGLSPGGFLARLAA